MATVCDHVNYRNVLKDVEAELKVNLAEAKGSGEAADWNLTFHSAFDPMNARKEERQRARANSIHGTYVIIKAKATNKNEPTEEFVHVKVFSPNDETASAYISDVQFNKTQDDKIEDL